MVGTMWLWVMRWRWMSRKVSSASQPSIITTPIPWASGVASEKASGAA